jgi:hypothetical protein
VPEGESATLAIAAASPDGSALAYRWLRNGIEVGSAGTGPSTKLQPTMFLASHPAESWQVEVRNAAGAVTSTATNVMRVNRGWQDVESAHPAMESAVFGDQRRLALHVDGRARVHVASVHEGNDGVLHIGFKGHSKDGAADGWGYRQTLAASPQASVSDLSMSSSWMGEVVATWLETRTVAGAPRAVVHAALYRPGATPAEAGSWVALGAISDGESLASMPTVVRLGGLYGIGWLQQAAVGQPRSAVLRRFDASAGGTPAEGLLDTVPMESVAADISRLQIIDGGWPLVMMFVEAAGSTPAKWQYTRSTGGIDFPALQDLAVDHRFARIHWAEPVNGITVLGTAGSDGRLFVRRMNLGDGQWLDDGWSYRANAYDSAPALLIDGEGRIDVFGISVDSANGWRSVIGHWRFVPGTGWGSASVLVQSDTDHRQSLGLRGLAAARDGNGNRLLVWSEWPAGGQPQALRSMRYSVFSATWTNPVTVAAPAAANALQQTPLLGMDVNGGRATLAWMDSDGGQDRIKLARLR